MIRSATKGDYATFAILFRELELDEAAPTFERWKSQLVHETLVSEHAGHVDGCVTFSVLGTSGNVRILVVAPHARGCGLGGDLMRAAATALRARGAIELHLNVKTDNANAIALYERLGFEVEHRSSVVELSWQCIGELPAEPATALPVSPDEDDDIERALGLLAGRIAMGRVRDGRTLVQLRDAGCAPVGYATFDPENGAMPFRVARPALAATLLAALEPHSRREHVQVFVEDDAALAKVLLAAGGETRRELLHYRAPLSC